MAAELHIGFGPRDDASLAHAAQQGDESAFAAIFDRYSTRLWNFACALSDGQFDAAQDLLQETFVRAYHRLHTLESPGALGSWLATLMRRVAANRRARTRRRTDLLDDRAADIPSAVFGAGGRNPEETYLSRELGETIHRALNRLSHSSRQIFVSFHVDGHSIAEISEETGLSVGAVKARLFQSRQKLKKELELMAPETTMPREIPAVLNIIHMGELQHQDDPLHPIRLTRGLLPRRLLYACRKGSKNPDELAQLLDADRAYVEDIVPDLVAGELLEEPHPGTYQTAFLFATRGELDDITRDNPFVDEGLGILRRQLPKLKRVLQDTDLVRRQGYDWSHLSWIALSVWIASRGLGRQVDRSPEWGKHRVWVYPIRPVAFWHQLGLADAGQGDLFSVDCRSSERDRCGMAFALAVQNLGYEPREEIDTHDQDRCFSRLSSGPSSEDDLLEGAKFPAEMREKLARYVESGFIRRAADDTFTLAVPLVTADDDAKLGAVVDEICAELGGELLDRALNTFVRKVDEFGFQHLLAQPHYLGFVGFLIVTSQLVRNCIDAGLLTVPESPDPNFGYWAWHEAPWLMKSWSKGR